MLFKTAVCDDEKEGREYIRRYLEIYHFETGVEFQTTFYTSADDLLSDYNEPGIYDLLFLDVEMPGSEIVGRGIELAKQIRSLPDNNVRIIFVSNYPEYMNFGYDVQASHYLAKGTPFPRFKQVLDSIIFRLEADKSILSVKTGRDEKMFLRINEILYAKSFHRERERVIYCMRNGEEIEERRAILSVSDDLKKHGFAFANKYCLVNLRFINRYDNGFLYLDTEEKIPLSRYYKKEFMDIFTKRILDFSN